MQLTFLFLVLCCQIQNSSPSSPPHPNAPWRRSRYIIDNRRNALFSKKPLPELLKPQEPTTFSQESFKQTLFPAERYQKDLTAEASISEPKFYQKLKSYKINGGLGNHPNHFGEYGNQKNNSGVLDPQNFLQNEDEILNDVGSKVITTTEKLLNWEFSVSSTATTSKEKQKTQISSQTIQEFEFDSPTTSYPWELNSKTEESNQIDTTNEKHVYETRIETVSFHQEVIFNPPKKTNWYQEEEKEPNYEEKEKNYEQSEQNYEESEKNYELDEAVNAMSGVGIHPPESEENQNKFGYVVEGTNYRKYRVEERTADGFIVGEYGVVSRDDGSLRGVRYTADGNTNPKLIYETLIKFLSL